MRLKTLWMALACLFSIAAHAQTGKITGKILNAKNEPLPGVSVKVVGIAGGVSSDVEGYYTLSLAAGKKYDLEFTAVGYSLKSVSDIEVVAGQVTSLDLMLEVAGKNLANVTVTSSRSSAPRETVNSLIQFQKNTNTVASVISAESIRRSPDKNTSEVLKRVPGTSIQEGKYLIVRGLSDRYNFAMLNGIPLSSTEPDRKTFSFDIFPAAMIDNIIINKAFVPELPGEWAGGLVQVNTKDIPAAGFLNVLVGTGFNTQTIGHDFYSYQGGKLDWLGMDNGFRAIPSALPVKSQLSDLDAAAKTELGKKFKNVWSADKSSGLALLNKKVELSGGFNKTLNGGAKLGATLGLTYNQTVRRSPFGNRPSVVNDSTNIATRLFDYNNEKYATDILWGGLANITLKLGNNHKISFKNLFNVNSTDYVTERTGVDFNDAGNGQNIKATELALKTNTFFNTQLSGDHSLPSIKTKLHWYGSFTILDQYIPDQRRIKYAQETSLAGNPYLLAVGASKSSQESGSRYYGFLNDYVYTAGGDITKSFSLLGLSQSVKAGYLLQVKDRLFDSRPFAIYLPSDNVALRSLTQDKVFAPENFGNGNDNKFAFNELSGYQYRYLANTILNAAFIQFDNQFTKDLRATWGLRVEDYDQLIGSVKQNDPRHLHTQIRDFLPGINITYKLTGNTNLRLSGSQTVIRPEFRELSDFQFYDFDMGATLTGNKLLERTKVTNADLRFEMYPRSGEIFTVGVFYKYFKNPIELFFNPSSGGGSTYNYINAEKATGYGVELEYRKKLDFVNSLRNFTFQTNLSYIYNRVSGSGTQLDRPMQGQSPYVFNASLQYDVEKLGLYTTLLYNQIGDRIFYVGGSNAPTDPPPVWEATRPVFDFQVAKKLIGGKGEIKLNISDILNKVANYYYDLDKNNKYSKGADALIINRTFGTTFNLSFSYNIK